MTISLIKAVVFDIGGVIIDWDPRYLYRRLIPDRAEREHFLREICSPQWNREQDRGRTFTEGVAELVARFPQHAPLIRAFQERWPETLGGPVPGTSELIRELGSRVPLFAITNWSAETFPVTLRRYPVLGAFREIVVSGEVGSVKPEEAIFRHARQRFGLPLDNCLFIDDSAENTRAATALGMVAVQFSDAAQLRQELFSHGLLGPGHTGR